MAPRQSRSEITQCVSVIRDLQELIVSSRRAFMSGNACVVDRQTMLDKLDELERCLPEAVRQANESLKSIDAYEDQIRQECTAKVTEANEKSRRIAAVAQQTEAEAQKKANNIAAAAAASASEQQRKAEEEARAIVESGRGEAARIVEEAQRHANALVAQEEIMRRARVEVKEMQEATQAQLAQLRRNTFDYLDNMLAQTDQHLGGLINELRMERNELNAQR